MKQILVLGAGKSSTILIEYLLSVAQKIDAHIHVADIDPDAAASKIGSHERGSASVILDAGPDAFLPKVKDSALVISLLPPPIHLQVAQDCLQAGIHFLNASYLTPEIKSMDAAAQTKGLCFLTECGLDPGIDHMSAMRLIDGIKDAGGKIRSFRSHCGGLLAPVCDNNPWHYKFSWNPRNVIQAGKEGALYREDNETIQVPYKQLFDPTRTVKVPGVGEFAWYPNRDSLLYLQRYGLEDIPTFVRTTLRHPDFCFGWKNLIDLKLTDDGIAYETDGMSLAAFFQIHFDRFGFSDWFEKTLSVPFRETRSHLEELITLFEADSARPTEEQHKDDIMLVNRKGDLRTMSVTNTRSNATQGIAHRMHEAKLALSQLFFLGLDSGELINQGKMTTSSILQWAMEKRMTLGEQDRDRIVMMHDIAFEQDGKHQQITSTLSLEGKDRHRTAMAMTVGLPLAIAAKKILQGVIKQPGVHIPVHPVFYNAILPELEALGISFSEEVKEIE